MLPPPSPPNAQGPTAPPPTPPAGYPASPYGPPPYYPPPSSYPGPYGSPYFSYPPPGFSYFPPPRNRSSKPTAAAALWVVVLLRDLFMLFMIAVWLSLPFGFPADFPFSLIDDPVFMVSVLVVGIGSTGTAMFCALTRSHHLIGTGAAIAAAAACITPGMGAGIGVVGVPLGVIALVLHLLSAREYRGYRGGPALPAYGPTP